MLVNTGVMGTSAADWIVVDMSTSGARAETPMLGQPRPQQDDENLTVDRSPRLHQVKPLLLLGPAPAPERRFRAQDSQVAEARRRPQIAQFGAPCPGGGALRIARSSRPSGWKGSGRQDRLACRVFSVH